MSSPSVSVVISCFNGEQFVADAIESALGQSHERVEVIVVDDGSTDGSLEVIRSFGDRICWETGPNAGGNAARNRGIELASGEFVQILDADDVLYPDKVSAQLSCSEKIGGKSISCSDYWRVGVDGERDPVRFRRSYGSAFEFALYEDQLQTSAPLHRKSHLEKVGGFRAGLPCCQEYELHIRLALAGYEFVPCHEALFEVRRRRNSVGSNYRKVLLQHEEIYLDLADMLESSDQFVGAIAKLAGAFARDARTLQRLGEPELAARFSSHAYSIHPEGGLEGAYSPLALRIRRLLGLGASEYLFLWKQRVGRATSALFRSIRPDLGR